MTSSIDLEALQRYQARTFRSQPGSRIHSKEEAIQYANERGFIFFWPIKDIRLPSLWSAVAGDRPVADAHDDPGHVTWGWKDELLGSHAWYYAKVLRKRATIIAWKAAPYFYALSENYGSPEEDYLTLYEQGRLTLEAKSVYEALLDKGTLDTLALRKAAHLTSEESEARFTKAISDLQADFKIVPVGVAQVGAWNYAFKYEIVARQYPELPDLAHEITERQARMKLTELYFLSVGAASKSDVAKLFGWFPTSIEHSLNALQKDGLVQRELAAPGKRGEWIALPELVENANRHTAGEPG
jgi:hypothetical protein